MVREIMKDEAFLAEASEKATAEDADTARDLLETLEAHKAGEYDRRASAHHRVR